MPSIVHTMLMYSAFGCIWAISLQGCNTQTPLISTSPQALFLSTTRTTTSSSTVSGEFKISYSTTSCSQDEIRIKPSTTVGEVKDYFKKEYGSHPTLYSYEGIYDCTSMHGAVELDNDAITMQEAGFNSTSDDKTMLVEQRSRLLQFDCKGYGEECDPAASQGSSRGCCWPWQCKTLGCLGPQCEFSR